MVIAESSIGPVFPSLGGGSGGSGEFNGVPWFSLAFYASQLGLPPGDPNGPGAGGHDYTQAINNWLAAASAVPNSVAYADAPNGWWWTQGGHVVGSQVTVLSYQYQLPNPSPSPPTNFAPIFRMISGAQFRGVATPFFLATQAFLNGGNVDLSVNFIGISCDLNGVNCPGILGLVVAGQFCTVDHCAMNNAGQLASSVYNWGLLQDLSTAVTTAGTTLTLTFTNPHGMAAAGPLNLCGFTGSTGVNGSFLTAAVTITSATVITITGVFGTNTTLTNGTIFAPSAGSGIVYSTCQLSLPSTATSGSRVTGTVGGMGVALTGTAGGSVFRESRVAWANAGGLPAAQAFNQNGFWFNQNGFNAGAQTTGPNHSDGRIEGNWPSYCGWDCFHFDTNMGDWHIINNHPFNNAGYHSFFFQLANGVRIIDNVMDQFGNWSAPNAGTTYYAYRFLVLTPSTAAVVNDGAALLMTNNQSHTSESAGGANATYYYLSIESVATAGGGTPTAHAVLAGNSWHQDAIGTGGTPVPYNFSVPTNRVLVVRMGTDVWTQLVGGNLTTDVTFGQSTRVPQVNVKPGGGTNTGTVYVVQAVGATSQTPVAYTGTGAVPSAAGITVHFIASGTWVVPPGCTAIRVVAKGGDGSGGGGGAGATGAGGGGGGGGGGGQVIDQTFTGLVPGTVITVTVNAAPTGGSGGVVGGAAATAGTQGGSVTVAVTGGATLTANGGGPGGAGNAAVTTTPGAAVGGGSYGQNVTTTSQNIANVPNGIPGAGSNGAAGGTSTGNGSLAAGAAPSGGSSGASGGAGAGLNATTAGSGGNHGAIAGVGGAGVAANQASATAGANGVAPTITNGVVTGGGPGGGGGGGIGNASTPGNGAAGGNGTTGYATLSVVG